MWTDDHMHLYLSSLIPWATVGLTNLVLFQISKSKEDYCRVLPSYQIGYNKLSVIAGTGTTNDVYVVNGFDNTVSVIDAKNGTKIKDISVGKGRTAIDAHFLPLSSYRDSIYVANSADNTWCIVITFLLFRNRWWCICWNDWKIHQSTADGMEARGYNAGNSLRWLFVCPKK